MQGIFLWEAYQINARSEYLEQATRYIDYCFGMNPLNRSFVTGYGSHYPKHPHHRPSLAKQITIPGMLVGGVNETLVDPIAVECLNGVAPSKRYIDHGDSYGTNEVDIYWNSMLVWVLAQLQLV